MDAEGHENMADLESFSFGDSPAAADECLELVLIGRKTATCWAASEGLKGVEVGKRWIVNDGQGRPRAIVETVEPRNGSCKPIKGYNLLNSWFFRQKSQTRSS